MNARRLGLAVVVLCFCAPLFVGLGHGDLRGDEAGHSFSVDRILETGDWLVPKGSPHENGEFLEKPPLKFWIVALPIRFGILPHNEFGLRFWDALFGGLAFLYVYAIGRRLAGPVCGAGAVLALFAFWPLVFDHGLRGNNMEAPLLLCYCGGVLHFLRSMEGTEDALRHKLAVALCFTLGFMTKFVAAIFLPLIILLSVALVPGYRVQFVRAWKGWAAASLLAVGLIAPWFVYASLRFGAELWSVMFGQQLVTRMTSFLDPGHVQPWPFYWVTLYKTFSYAGALPVVFLGVIALAAQTIRRRWPDGLVILVWGLVPVLLISFGTSKLTHYMYPFVPAFALAAGYLAALVVMLAPAPFARIGWPKALLAVAVLAGCGIVAATAFTGEARLSIAGHVVFRSSTLFRPVLVTLVAACLAMGTRSSARLAAMLVAIALLPVPAYAQNLLRLEDSPSVLRPLRDCLLRVEAREASRGLYVDLADEDMQHHVYYYFRGVRPWIRADSSQPVDVAAVGKHIEAPVPMLFAASRYDALVRDASRDGRTSQLAPAMSVDTVKVLLPGPYAACAPAASAR